MKKKTVASRRKRHELKNMVLELAEKVEWKEVELAAESSENNQLKREIEQIKLELDLQENLLKDTKVQLIAQKRITAEVTKGNEETVKDFLEQSRDINRLNDVVAAANAELCRRDNIISNLNNTISGLQFKVIELCNEMEQIKKPFWEKLKIKLVKNS